MAANLIVVFGASGHVGSVVASRLLDAGKHVRVVGRNAEKLTSLVTRGAEAVIGSVEEPALLRRALAGAHAAFVLLPPYFGSGVRAWQDQTAAAIGDALEAEKVQYALLLSSIGADLATGNGPVAGLHVLEQRLERIKGLALYVLRPGYFFENHLGAIAGIRAAGLNVGALRADLMVPQIASRDVGEVAARRLAALDWRGLSVQELHGERDLTFEEATRALGAAIGKPDLRYVQVPYAEAARGMAQAGLPEELAGIYVDMARGFNDGKVVSKQRRSAASTTPTSIERWAKEIFAPVYAASAPKPMEAAGMPGHA